MPIDAVRGCIAGLLGTQLLRSHSTTAWARPNGGENTALTVRLNMLRGIALLHCLLKEEV
jgi:hypothetical protein